jgi:hypothetical protein
MKKVLELKGGEYMGLKIKNHTKGLGPLSFLMGEHSYSAKGKRGTSYGYTRINAVDNYNKKYSKKK